MSGLSVVSARGLGGPADAGVKVDASQKEI